MQSGLDMRQYSLWAAVDAPKRGSGLCALLGTTLRRGFQCLLLHFTEMHSYRLMASEGLIRVCWSLSERPPDGGDE